MIFFFLLFCNVLLAIVLKSFDFLSFSFYKRDLGDVFNVEVES
jgi:hypothetical protein